MREAIKSALRESEYIKFLRDVSKQHIEDLLNNLADVFIGAGIAFNPKTDIGMAKFKYADEVYGVEGSDILCGLFVGYISDSEGVVLSDGIIHPIKIGKICYTQIEAQELLEKGCSWSCNHIERV